MDLNERIEKRARFANRLKTLPKTERTTGRDHRVRKFRDGWIVEDSHGQFVAFRRDARQAQQICAEHNRHGRRDRSERVVTIDRARLRDADFSRATELQVKRRDTHLCPCHGTPYRNCPFN